MDESVAAWRIDLGSQLADKHIECIVFHLSFMSPYVFKQAGARYYAARVPHEKIEKRELLSRKRNRRTCTLHLVSCRIDHQITDL
jgi:hypothetical protein